MAVRKLILIVLWCSSWASGQLSGRFFLDKETYARGEPVFLHFEVINRGTVAVEIGDDDPYTWCGGYLVKVSSDPGPVPSSFPDSIQEGCGPNTVVLAPGEEIHRRILLNFEHEVSAPGEYDLTASRELTHDSETDANGMPVVLLQLNEHLRFRVEPTEVSPVLLNTWVRRLYSSDWKVADEAGRVLASLAPHSCEGLLLGFAKDDSLKNWAPLALSRLKTERSLAALAQLVRSEEPGYPVHTESAEFLAETGDPRWFPLLVDVARKNADSPNYVVYAAMSGGDKAMPLLRELLRSSDHQVLSGAIAGLGATGSHEAVPVLIDLLKDSNFAIASDALASLRQLTHHDSGVEVTVDNIEDHYPLWARWWNQEGKTARIYKANEREVEQFDPPVP